MASKKRVLTLSWRVKPGPSAAEEMEMAPLLVASEREFGTGDDLPPTRLTAIAKAAAARGMSVLSALSLRRALMSKRFGRGIDGRGIGPHERTHAHATLFEAALEAHLRAQGIKFMTEAEVKAPFRHTHTPFPLSPDFLLLDDVIINGHKINWIEAKAFYAAASNINAPAGAIGSLPAKAQRYAAAFGPGAFVFLRGFSRDLIPRFERYSTLLLDATPISPRLLCLLSDGHVGTFPAGWDHAPSPLVTADGAVIETTSHAHTVHHTVRAKSAAASDRGRRPVAEPRLRRLASSVSLERQVS